MSDEPESMRFPRQVWDDFAVFAARYGFASSFVAWMIGLAQVSSFPSDGPLVATVSVASVALCLAVAVLTLFRTTRFRALGLVPISATSLMLGIGSIVLTGEVRVWNLPLVFGGFIVGSLSVVRPQFTPPTGEFPLEWIEPVCRFHMCYTVVFGGGTILSFLFFVVVNFARLQGVVIASEVATLALWYGAVVSAILCVWCWLRFFRPFFEMCVEPLFSVPYRVRKKGPGLKQFPPFGPCLVIANHACWFDPIFVAKALPRPVTPIMTARFFNVWFLKPILKYVFRVIVVPETPLKRETPELEQAVAALDRGEVVVIFPEGYLRRKEEVPLRRFGQGVWRILSARPDTPVVACWVEGGWGSKFSYMNGPPSKNKPMDFRRPINIAVSAPEVVPSEVLADQMATRLHLMNRVAGMRAELGLPLLPPFDTPQIAEHQEESA